MEVSSRLGVSDFRLPTRAELLPDQILATSFRAQNIPPPMSSYQLKLPEPPIHIAAFPTTDSIAVLLPRGKYQVWDLNTRISKPGSRGGGKVASPEIIREGHFQNAEQVDEYRQIVGDAQGQVHVLVTLRGGEDAVISQDGESFVSENPVGRIVAGVEGVTSIDIEGTIFVRGGA